MGKRDSLILNISKLQQNMNIDFGESKCYDQIYNNDMLLLYKYVTLLHIQDLRKAEKYIDRFIDDPNYDSDVLSAKRLEIEDEESLYGMIYSSSSQYENILCLPIDKKFEEFMLNHKKDLEGIYDVNEQSVHEYSELINQSIFKLEEENEEINIEYSEVERLNEEAMTNNLFTPSLDQEDINNAEVASARLNQVKQELDGKELTQEVVALIAQIEELINAEDYIKANELIDDLEYAMMKSSQEKIYVEEEEATKEEIEQESDRRISEDEQKNIDEVLGTHIEENSIENGDDEISY